MTMQDAALSGAPPEIVDRRARQSALERLRERKVVLPTFRQLADPSTFPRARRDALAKTDPDAPDPANLWRIHWFNGSDRRSLVDLPTHFEVPAELAGANARIIVLIGENFPMIGAHKVLPAYAGLATRLVTGQFDPKRQRAVWPSTGNYCRGGVAISRILGCEGVAVLPEGMSKERFDWLEKWTSSPSSIIRTPGTESNVKEIYDATNRLALSDENVILNQFSAFSNYLAHRLCTGLACEKVFEDLARTAPDARLTAFVSATGSAGTIAAGDRLKARFGAKIAAVESLECPTMLRNGYGEHNIQGIGDKHIPLIHNVMNTDFVIDVSDSATDALNLLFGSEAGRAYLRTRKQAAPEALSQLARLGISGIANIVAAIKLAKYLDAGADDVIMTVATDGADLYQSERESFARAAYPNGFDEVDSAEIAGAYLTAISTDNMIELTRTERLRIFNLGYYTWVEQQGVALADFDRRRDQRFWDGLYEQAAAWDELIDRFNRETQAG